MAAACAALAREGSCRCYISGGQSGPIANQTAALGATQSPTGEVSLVRIGLKHDSRLVRRRCVAVLPAADALNRASEVVEVEHHYAKPWEDVMRSALDYDLAHSPHGAGAQP